MAYAPSEIIEKGNADDPPDLEDEVAPLFMDVNLENETDMSDIKIQIVPTDKGGEHLATNKNIGEVANAFGGIDATDSTYIHAPYAADLKDAKIVGVEKQDLDVIKSNLGHPSFNEFANEAYAAERGYAIRTNPTTGQKEMFIAGTRTKEDWASNVIEMRPKGGSYYAKHMFKDLADSEEFDDAYGHHASSWRDEAQAFYEQIAEEEGVEVIYGHSRGGAIVADMKMGDNVQKVGLDAAMVLADNKGMINYYEGGDTHGGAWAWTKSRFDAGIGLSGKNNQHMNMSKKIHHSWGD